MILRRLTDLVYYWTIDDRPRKQYLHVLRSLRSDLKEFIQDDKIYKDLYYAIPPEIKQSEIEGCIEKLKEIIRYESSKKEETGEEKNPSSEE